MLNIMLQGEAPVSRDQLRRDIQQTVREAQAAAEKAAKAAADQATGSGGRVIVGPQGVPIISVQPPFSEPRIPPEAKQISIVFFIVIGAVIVGLPLVRAAWSRMVRNSC